MGIFAPSRHLLNSRASLSLIDENLLKPESMFAIMAFRFPIQYFSELL